jgi:hypothetical protein
MALRAMDDSEIDRYLTEKVQQLCSNPDECSGTSGIAPDD